MNVATERIKPLSYPVTDEWRELVRARMRALGISKADLSRLIPTSDVTVTHLISESDSNPSAASTLVPRIHAILGWPPPPNPEDVIADDPRRAELLALVRDSGDAELQALLEIARTLGSLHKK